MTTSDDLVSRVRTNINESSTVTDPQRTDAEIRQWLDDAQNDYIAKVPPENLPELFTDTTSVTSPWTIATDYVRLIQVLVNHTISGTTTTIEPAYILQADEVYIVQRYSGGIGAYAQFQNNKIAFGPNPITADIRYQKHATSLHSAGVTFTLRERHEDPVVNYATFMALNKINDEDADRFLTAYKERLAAEGAE